MHSLAIIVVKLSRHWLIQHGCIWITQLKIWAIVVVINSAFINKVDKYSENQKSLYLERMLTGHYFHKDILRLIMDKIYIINCLTVMEINNGEYINY